jgi:Spy/CpxP family protein refolding chaperone
MKRMIIASLLVTLFFGTTALFAQPQKPLGPNGRSMGPRFDGTRMQFMLNLTDEQTKTFNDIRYKHQMEAIDLRAELDKNRAEVRKMMADENVNSDKLLALTKANNEILAKMRTSRTQMWLDVYNILDDNQKEIWTTRFNQFGGRQGKGFRAGGRHHGGFGRNNCMGYGPGRGNGPGNGYGPRYYKWDSDQ